jgi:hypothetical protein
MRFWKPYSPAFFLLIFMILGGCAPRGVLVFLSEPFGISRGEGSALERELSRSVSAHGFQLRLVVSPVSESVKDRLDAELSQPWIKAAVIDPLFSLEAESLAAGYPDVSFVLLGESNSRELSINVRRLIFDRRVSFQTAGYASVVLLRTQDPNGADYDAQEGGSRIAILLPHSRAMGDSAVSAFIKGCLEAGGSSPTVMELNEPLDKSAVAKGVEDLRKQGIQIILPRLGELNGACLAALKASGGIAVTEDWEGTGAYADQVFLSVEEDIIGGIAACLAPSEDPRSTVIGPVRVVCGRARPVPQGLEGRITCR